MNGNSIFSEDKLLLVSVNNLVINVKVFSDVFSVHFVIVFNLNGSVLSIGIIDNSGSSSLTLRVTANDLNIAIISDDFLTSVDLESDFVINDNNFKWGKASTGKKVGGGHSVG